MSKDYLAWNCPPNVTVCMYVASGLYNVLEVCHTKMSIRSHTIKDQNLIPYNLASGGEFFLQT